MFAPGRGFYSRDVKQIVFSDLDGTLIDQDTYSCDAAKSAIATLREREIPLVLCSSKTRTEMEWWRERIVNQHPFIVENGGAIYIPRGYFPFVPESSTPRGEYDVIEFGAPYRLVVAELRKISQEVGCPVIGFDQMSVAEICLRTSLSVRQAELAKQREYDEPFEILGANGSELLGAIERRGKSWIRGSRLHHITAGHSKATAVRCLASLYAQAHDKVITIGLGDSDGDAEFLRTTDEPIIVWSRFALALAKLIPNASITRWPGPLGWNEAIQQTIAEPALAGSV
jgi:mannosyl-3-phosphoglycerate phosphatase